MIKSNRKSLTVAAAFAAAALWTTAAAAAPVSISTLPPGAINNVQAQVIAKVIQQHTDLQMRVATFNGPAAILGSCNADNVEFAFTSNDETGAAFRGEDYYKGRAMPNLRIAATIFSFPVGIVVRKDSNIKTVKDLKGKRYPVGWQGFQQGIPLSEAQLATGGLTMKDTDGVPTANLLRAADDFKAGKLDATTFAVGAPKMAEIDAAIGIRFLSFDNSPASLKRMKAVRPEYGIATFQPNPHLPGVIGPTNLMVYDLMLVTNKNVSDEVVYKAVKALYNNKKALVAGHPSFNSVILSQMAAPQPGMTYHPGAIKFFKEVGIWKGK